jgi:ribonuclease BN (tRNA processing enzyme)
MDTSYFRQCIKRLDREAFVINNIKDNMNIQIKDIKISFKIMMHPYEDYACKFECSGKSIVYSGDTSYNEDLPKFSKDADLLLADSGFTESHRGKRELVHMTGAEDGIVAKSAGVKKLILTHFWPYDDTAVNMNEAKRNFENVEASIIGKSYNI